MLLLLLLLLLFVVVHLPLEVFFIQQQYLPSILIASCMKYERMFFTVEVHPLAEQSLLCGLGFTSYYIIYLVPLFANTGMREAAGGRQPASAKPSLYIHKYIHTHD